MGVGKLGVLRCTGADDAQVAVRSAWPQHGACLSIASCACDACTDTPRRSTRNGAAVHSSNRIPSASSGPPARRRSPLASTAARKAGLLMMSNTLHATWQTSGLPANVEPWSPACGVWSGVVIASPN